MKNIKVLIYTFIISAMFMACEDEEKEPVLNNLIVKAPFVSLDVESPVINISDLENSFFGGTLEAPDDNVASHEVWVSRFSGGVSSDTVLLRTITEFPVNFQVNANDLAEALGIGVEDLLAGDRFDFVCNSVGKDGRELPFSDIDADFLGGDGAEGDLNQFYILNTFLSCPFDSSAIGGTYDIVNLGFAGFFGETNFVREVVAGPGANQLTIVGGEYPSAGSTDLIVSVDPVTGAASLGGPGTAFSAEAGAFATDDYGSVSGFVFSCTGDITLTVDFNAFAGNAHPFVLKKQ